MGSHPVEILRQGLGFLTDDAPMRPIPRWIPGRAFFPGGAGLFIATKANPLPLMPQRPVMLVGHNFDSESSYAQSLAGGEEPISTGTWKWLLKVLGESEIDPADCFFTNAIMGLMPGDKNTGVSPGFRDRRFRSRCADYLRFQIEIIQPRAVITMGLEAFEVVREAIPSIGGRLPSVDWSTIDRCRQQFLPSVTLCGQSFCLAGLVHPSFRNSNVHRRSFEDKTGNAAEIDLLRRASAALNTGVDVGDRKQPASIPKSLPNSLSREFPNPTP